MGRRGRQDHGRRGGGRRAEARPLPHRSLAGGQQYIGETEANLRRFSTRPRRTARSAVRRGRRPVRRAQPGEGQPRPLRQHRGQLPPAADGSYAGLAILTTNMRQGIDQAFLRRIRFAVEFPFPDAAHRAAIWRGVFPAATRPRGSTSSGSRTCAWQAAASVTSRSTPPFWPPGEGTEVTMELVLEMARIEFRKLERHVNDADFAVRGGDPMSTRDPGSSVVVLDGHRALPPGARRARPGDRPRTAPAG